MSYVYRCDRCGEFTKHLTPVASAYPGGGIDHEICDRCAGREGS